MRVLRFIVNVGLSVVMLHAVVSSQAAHAAATEKPTMGELVEAAKKRTAEATERASAVKPNTGIDQTRVEEVARKGRERGVEEFERRAAIERQKHDEAVAKFKGESGEKPVAAQAEQKPIVSGRLVVALSSSMPDDMVREYMRQLDKVPEAIVVLRGFVGGAKKVAPTGVWVERVRRKQPDCRDCPHYMVEVVVDPLAYDMLGIAKVPAVTFLPGVQDLRHCDADVLEASSVAYGATSVRASLKAIRTKNVMVPDELLRRLGGS